MCASAPGLVARPAAAFEGGVGCAAEATRAAGHTAWPYEWGKVTMSRRGPGALAVVTIAIGVLLAGGGLVSNVRAQTAPDRSEVVIVLDFSASILQDAANRNKFGAALERIADRVDATSADLIAGDAVVTIVDSGQTYDCTAP